MYEIVLWSTRRKIGRYLYLERYMLLDQSDRCNAFHMSKFIKYNHFVWSGFEMMYTTLGYLNLSLKVL